MARPPKNPESRMAQELRIRVTSEQHRLITEAVHLEQTDISAWARSILVQAAKDRAAKENARRRKGEVGA